MAAGLGWDPKTITHFDLMWVAKGNTPRIRDAKGSSARPRPTAPRAPHALRRVDRRVSDDRVSSGSGPLRRASGDPHAEEDDRERERQDEHHESRETETGGWQPCGSGRRRASTNVRRWISGVRENRKAP